MKQYPLDVVDLAKLPAEAEEPKLTDQEAERWIDSLVIVWNVRPQDVAIKAMFVGLAEHNVARAVELSGLTTDQWQSALRRLKRAMMDKLQ